MMINMEITLLMVASFRNGLDPTFGMTVDDILHTSALVYSLDTFSFIGSYIGVCDNGSDIPGFGIYNFSLISSSSLTYSVTCDGMESQEYPLYMGQIKQLEIILIL